MRFSRSLMVSVVVVVCVGCGSAGTPDGGVGAPGGGGAGGGTGGSGGGPAGPTTTKGGSVTLSQSVFTVGGMDYVSGSVVAAFSTIVSSGPPNSGTSCTTQTVGSCTSSRCVTVDAGTPVDAGFTLTQDSAGVITIAGTKLDGGVTLVPSADNTYAALSATSRLSAVGDTLTVSAAGATVPAFSGKTVVTPASVTVTAPGCAASNCGSIPRNAPLLVTWTGGTVGTVTVSAFVGVGAETSIVQCSYDASAGTGTVPTAALGTLPAGMGSFSVSVANKTTFTAGSYDVSLAVQGSGVAGSATFQ